MNCPVPRNVSLGASPQTRVAEPPLEIGRAIIQHEADALGRLAAQLDESFSAAVTLLESCRGGVIVSGMGKAGLIGQKIAATLASTGTRSHFLHPAEAIHGDLGRIHEEDLVLLLSHSGETDEVVRLLPSLMGMRVPIIAVTGRRLSPLAQRATVTLWIGDLQEAGPLGLAPSTSTTAMLAMGDALALATSQRRGFTHTDFARFHPGGSLGRMLARVEDVMRPLAQCRVGRPTQTVREILVTLGRPGRRSGAVLLVDPHAATLEGIFTDSDLARLFERQQEHLLDQPIACIMTNSPTCIRQGTMMSDAVRVLTERKISELPVIDERGRPLGLIDITDVVGGSADASDSAGSGRVATGSEADDSEPTIYSLPNRLSTHDVDEA